MLNIIYTNMPTVTKKPGKRAWMQERKAFSRVSDKANRHIYDSVQWKKDRALHKQAFPLCAICLSKGLAVDSVVSDHIVPINEGGSVWSWDNRQMLCVACHNNKSRQEAKRARRGAALNP